jgi:hypothetical protein
MLVAALAFAETASSQIVSELEPASRRPASESPNPASTIPLSHTKTKSKPTRSSTTRSMGLAKESAAELSAHIELAYSTPTTRGDAWGPLWGESTQFPSEQRHSKLVYLFDRSVRLKRIQIESCGAEFSDAAEIWLDHLRKAERLEGGRSQMSWKLENDGEKVQSISVAFLESAGVCLKKVDLETEPSLLTPKWVRVGEDSIANWADGVPLAEGPDRGRLNFNEEIEFDGVRIWLGDHLPLEAWPSSGRPREVELRAKGISRNLVLPLRDTRFAQEFRFADLVAGESPWAKGVKTRSISFAMRGVHSGTSEQAQARDRARIAEVQLLSRDHATPILLRSARIPEQDDVKAWRALDFAKVLDRELKSDEREGTEASWVFRFRSDGSYFAGNVSWSSQGRWRVLGRPSSDGLRLELKGGKWRTPRPSDTVPCASRCHAVDEQRGIASQMRTQAGEISVSEVVELQKFERARWILRNRNPPAARNLDFSDVRLRVNSLFD